ncbi:hypothetical protein KBX50_05240 [Micromonospora sp. C51]|uniref:hypothetical protein n=1 Tax=Micromonospora sp. C51 TaxID=2824879 RepID=UPI001B392CAD|nr:hypothetical protein [Micromonospora sp. C51]MBQ1047863.1 hypothetical protein [Micromonospora sp. C51]
MFQPANTPASPPAPTPSADTAQKATTPWRELPLEDQVAYWQAQSRKHENRQLAALGLKPGELDDLRAKATANEDSYRQALTAAEERGRTAAQQQYGLQLADAHIRMAVGDRMTKEQVDGLLTHLNLSQFLTADHAVDADKVSQFVALLPAPATTTTPPPDPAASTGTPATGVPAAPAARVDMGQGTPRTTGPSGIEAGRLIAQQRFGTAKQPAPAP